MSVIALDQGTTSTRAMRFDRDGRTLASAVRDLPQIHPRSGWVELDPERIWLDACDVVSRVVDDTVTALGIANQRETILVWERESGRPIHNAIVWQDRRTVEYCAQLVADGLEDLIHARTGLRVDPYFSASKLRWILDTVPDARRRAECGELACGTVESFLIWRFTGGRTHVSDITNASRTMLFDISRCAWDADLLRLFDIPEALLPQIVDNAEVVGETPSMLTGRPLPIAGIAGDQQAALIGQGCFSPGSGKATYGTGCFLLANIGAKPILSSKRLLTTVGYRIGDNVTYAVEGAAFSAGSALNWLRDGLHLLDDITQSARMAASVSDDHGLYFVPAFSGLGAPHWLADARAILIGFNLDTRPAHVVRAALEAVAYQTGDLVEAIRDDAGMSMTMLRADGGMITNQWFAQFLANMIGVRIERPANAEATAMGVASLAGLATGYWAGINDLPMMNRNDTVQFSPEPMPCRAAMRQGWLKAIETLRFDAGLRRMAEFSARCNVVERRDIAIDQEFN